MVDDKRTRHTEERINKAIIACLEHTSLDRITVVQICEAAGINRSTFYAHYSDPIHLYKILEKRTVDTLTGYFNELKDKNIAYMDFIKYFLEYVKQNNDSFCALYNTDSISLKKAVIDIIERYDFLGDTIFKKDRVYVWEYFINGVFSIVALWLKDKCVKSVDEMAAMIYRLTLVNSLS